MNEETKKLIHSLFDSLGYNRDEEYMYNTILELIDRVSGVYEKWTDDADIIYGMFICAYGDYGTSPRSGWFENKNARKEILAILKHEKYDLEHYTTWGQEKFGYTGMEKDPYES